LTDNTFETSSDGQTSTIAIYEWISTPHLYFAGNSILLYVGTNTAIVSVLDAAAGQKFAGPGAKPVELPDDGTNSLSLPGSPDIVTVPAPVVSVGEVTIAESFPPQYFLQVTSGQPNGCNRNAGWEVDIEQAVVRVTVLNSQPADLTVVLCTEIYVETVHNVALGSDAFQSGVEYSLFVNDVSYGTFKA
jgi:hypothetical protein